MMLIVCRTEGHPDERVDRQRVYRLTQMTLAEITKIIYSKHTQCAYTSDLEQFCVEYEL